MAERKPLFVHSDGYADSFDPSVDYMEMAGLVIGGASYAAGNIVLNSGKIQGLAAGNVAGEALSYNQNAAQLTGLNIDVSDLTLTSGATITGLPTTPSGSTEAASKAYVDSVASGGAADSIENTFTGVEDVVAGDPVYWEPTTDDEFGKGDADNRSKAYVFGVASETKTSGNPCKVISQGKAAGVLSGATTGDFYFLQSGGGLGTTVPAGQKWVVAMGRAMNATDLWVQVEVVGRKPL